MIKPKPPCENCEARKPRCHATCEKYIKFRNDLTEFNSEVRQLRFQDYAITNYLKHRVKK